MKNSEFVKTWTLRASPPEARVIEGIIEEHGVSVSDAIRKCIRSYAEQRAEAERIAAMEKRLGHRIDAVGGVVKELVAALREYPRLQEASPGACRSGAMRCAASS